MGEAAGLLGWLFFLEIWGVLVLYWRAVTIKNLAIYARLY